MADNLDLPPPILDLFDLRMKLELPHTQEERLRWAEQNIITSSVSPRTPASTVMHTPFTTPRSEVAAGASLTLRQRLQADVTTELIPPNVLVRSPIRGHARSAVLQLMDNALLLFVRVQAQYLRFVASRPPPRLHLGTAKAIDENFSDLMRNSGGSALYSPQSFSSLMRITAALARLDLADNITFAHYVDARQLLESCADDAAATGSDAIFSDLRRGGPSRVGDIRMQRVVFLKAMLAHCEQEGKVVHTLKECWDVATRRGIGCAADEFKTLILEPLMAVNNQKIMVSTADTEKNDNGREGRIVAHVRSMRG
jgi:DNA replicative helicase MCM subunit Mcm2 (Cdc46/Mcm family)